MRLEDWATWQEIHAQPAICRDWAARLDVAGLRNRMAGLGPRPVWFCGAGTSACIGNMLAAGLEGRGDFRVTPQHDLHCRRSAGQTKGKRSAASDPLAAHRA